MSPLPQGFRRECLPQDHMVSHCVCVLGEGVSQGVRDTGASWTSGRSHCVPLLWHGKLALCALTLCLQSPHPHGLTKLLPLLWASRERFVGTKMV